MIIIGEQGTGSRVLHALFAVIYAASIMISCYITSTLSKIASMAILPIAFFSFLVHPDLKRLRVVSMYPVMMLAGLFTIYAYSVLIWMINIEEAAYVTIGTTRFSFQIIGVLVVFAAVYVFGHKVVDYTLFGAFAANGLTLLNGLRRFGIGASIRDFLNTIRTGDQVGFMAFTEINDLTYIYGFFILYYLLISDDSLKKRLIMIGLCSLFVLLGFKRIIFMALFVGLLIIAVYTWLPERFQKPFISLVAIITALLAFLYIPFIRSGMFNALMEHFQINTKGRSGIYTYFSQIYDFSPTFRGYGLEYVMRYLEYLKTIKAKFYGSSVKYLHNDILKQYIELGFPGFCVWLYSTCIFSCNWMKKTCGLRGAAMYAAINAVNYINFSTGNTNHSYVVRLCFAAVVFGTISKQAFEGTRRTKGSPELSP